MPQRKARRSRTLTCKQQRQSIRNKRTGIGAGDNNSVCRARKSRINGGTTMMYPDSSLSQADMEWLARHPQRACRKGRTVMDAERECGLCSQSIALYSELFEPISANSWTAFSSLFNHLKILSYVSHTCLSWTRVSSLPPVYLGQRHDTSSTNTHTVLKSLPLIYPFFRHLETWGFDWHYSKAEQQSPRQCSSLVSGIHPFGLIPPGPHFLREKCW